MGERISAFGKHPVAQGEIVTSRRADQREFRLIHRFTLVARQRIGRCWNVPAGVRDAHNLVVRVQIQMDPSLWNSISAGGDGTEFTSAQVQFALLPLVLNKANRIWDHHFLENQIQISF